MDEKKKELVMEFDRFVETTLIREQYSDDRCAIYEHWLDLKSELLKD